MGSFDIACSVSGISLYGEQPVKLFFIVPSSWGSRNDGLIGPNSMYSFCSFEIDATYYDYGQYEIDHEQPNWVEFVRFVQGYARCVEQGENPFHEKAFDPGNPEHLEQGYLLEQVMEGRVLVKGLSTGGSFPVSHYPVHRTVYNDVLMSDRMWTGARSSTFFREKIADILSQKDELLVGYLLGSRVMLDGDSFMSGYNFASYREQYGDEALVKNIVNMNMMIMWLDNVHKVVVPSVYAGQEPFYEEIIDFHRKCAEIAVGLKAKSERE